MPGYVEECEWWTTYWPGRDAWSIGATINQNESCDVATGLTADRARELLAAVERLSFDDGKAKILEMAKPIIGVATGRTSKPEAVAPVVEGRSGEVLMDIKILSDHDDTGPYKGQYCSYTIEIVTSMRTIRIAGCHDITPEVVDLCPDAG